MTVAINEILLTPEIAAKLLASNDSNRPCNQAHVNRLSEEMKSGRWRFNGDTICWNGARLIDGQHRCKAVLKSGVSIRAILVTGLDSDVFDTKDTGKKRTPADIMAINGEKHYSTLGAALSVVNSINSGFQRQKMPNSCLVQMLELYPDLRESVDWCRKKGNKNLLVYSVMCGLHCVFARKSSRIAADMFFGLLIDGIGLEKGDPIYALRERLISNISSKAKIPAAYAAAITIKSFNHWRAGTPIKYLRWSKDAGEAFPEVEHS